MHQNDSRRGASGQGIPDLMIGDVLGIEREDALFEGAVQRERSQHRVALDGRFVGKLVRIFCRSRTTGQDECYAGRQSYSECGGNGIGTVIHDGYSCRNG